MQGPERTWRDALDQGRLLLQRDVGSGACFFPPRVISPSSGRDWEWVEASGRGTIYSVSLVHPRPPEPPYAVVLVELEEGPRMMSHLPGIDPSAIRIGMPVVARITPQDSERPLRFEPA